MRKCANAAQLSSAILCTLDFTPACIVMSIFQSLMVMITMMVSVVVVMTATTTTTIRR